MFSESEIWERYHRSVLPLGVRYKENVVIEGALSTPKGPIVLKGTCFMVATAREGDHALFATAHHVIGEARSEIDSANGEAIGHYLTRDHSVATVPHEPVSIAVQFHEAPYNCWTDTDRDFALYTFGLHESLRTCLPIPLSTDVRVGDPVVTIGFPFTGPTGEHVRGKPEFLLRRRLTTAHVAALVDSAKGIHVEFDNFAARGNSGGPLINCRTGLAVGIVIETLERNGAPTTFSYAVSAFEAMSLEANFQGLLVVRK